MAFAMMVSADKDGSVSAVSSSAHLLQLFGRAFVVSIFRIRPL